MSKIEALARAELEARVRPDIAREYLVCAAPSYRGNKLTRMESSCASSGTHGEGDQDCTAREDTEYTAQVYLWYSDAGKYETAAFAQASGENYLLAIHCLEKALQARAKARDVESVKEAARQPELTCGLEAREGSSEEGEDPLKDYEDEEYKGEKE
jgi:hypothetical protein